MNGGQVAPRPLAGLATTLRQERLSAGTHPAPAAVLFDTYNFGVSSAHVKRASFPRHPRYHHTAPVGVVCLACFGVALPVLSTFAAKTLAGSALTQAPNKKKRK